MCFCQVWREPENSELERFETAGAALSSHVSSAMSFGRLAQVSRAFPAPWSDFGGLGRPDAEGRRSSRLDRESWAPVGSGMSVASWLWLSRVLNLIALSGSWRRCFGVEWHDDDDDDAARQSWTGAADHGSERVQKRATRLHEGGQFACADLFPLAHACFTPLLYVL